MPSHYGFVRSFVHGNECSMWNVILRSMKRFEQTHLEFQFFASVLDSAKYHRLFG